MLSKTKLFLLLLFFINESLFARSDVRGCIRREKFEADLEQYSKSDICKQKSITMVDRISKQHAYLYIKIPKLSSDYLEYSPELKRRERAIPILIDLDGMILNPIKEDAESYEVSSKFKEKIILENEEIKNRSCLSMALGTEYLFPIIAKEGELIVVLFYNYTEVAKYESYQDMQKGMLIKTVSENYFDQFANRSLRTHLKFEPNKIYKIQIEVDPTPSKSIYKGTYTSYAFRKSLIDKILEKPVEMVKGFEIDLIEMPDDTKFDFDGKDDKDKTIDQVRKEFIFYDKEK
jgi:hypothetical protein